MYHSISNKCITVYHIKYHSVSHKCTTMYNINVCITMYHINVSQCIPMFFYNHLTCDRDFFRLCNPKYSSCLQIRKYISCPLLKACTNMLASVGLIINFNCRCLPRRISSEMLKTHYHNHYEQQHRQ